MSWLRYRVFVVLAYAFALSVSGISPAPAFFNQDPPKTPGRETPPEADGQPRDLRPAPPLPLVIASPSDNNDGSRALERALEASTPPAVQSVIAIVNQKGKARAGYTGFARRHLERQISERRLAGLQNLPKVAPANARDITTMLTPEHVNAIASDTISRLTGTRPPKDLKAKIAKQNVEFPRLVGLRSSVRAIRVPSPQLASFDWRQKNWIVQDSGIVTAAKDQSRPVSCGCCWAFASVGTVEAAYARTNLQLISGSEQYLLNCTGSLLASAGIHGGVPYSCDGGWWAFDVLTPRITPRGLPSAADLNYLGVQQQCAGSFDLRFKLESWGYVSSGQNPNEIPTNEEIKQALCDYGPLAVAVNVADANAWFLYNGNGTLQDWRSNVQSSVNHAIMIVGWDDTRDQNQGAWVIKNSWGEDWGEQGFGYVRYHYNNIGFGAAWVVPVKVGN